MKRYTLDGRPGALALGPKGHLFVGMPGNQSVLEIDPGTDAILREVILDDPDIAATKELVTMRYDARNERLVIAQGSDESVTILGLPELGVVRELTLEGELIRDAIPDPLGRYLFVLGRDVHVFDAEGDAVIRTIRDVAPMAMAVSEDGAHLAVIGSEEFSAGTATVVSLWDLATLKEIAREPLQTDRTIRAAVFAAKGDVLAVVADDWFAEKPLRSSQGRAEMKEDAAGQQRMKFTFGDLVSSETICLSDAAGPQAVAPSRDGRVVYFPEKRCGSSGSFVGSKRNVRGASLYAVDATAIFVDPSGNGVWASDPAGHVTLFKPPAPREP